MTPLPLFSGPPWQGIRYFCTTRHGGISAAPYDSLNLGDHVGDDARAVAENRRRLVACLPCPPVWMQQVHGTAVFQADAADPAPFSGANVSVADTPVADAIITTRPQQTLAILTADCLPVLMGDTRGRVLGLAHAGWRGLAAGVLEHTFSHLQARLCSSQNTPPHARWRAWIGPGISQRHFEVGPEVRDAFLNQNPDATTCFIAGKQPGKWLADLPGLAARRLHHMGVDEVWQSHACTVDRPELFYSYRRSHQHGHACGRMATVAWRTALA